MTRCNRSIFAGLLLELFCVAGFGQSFRGTILGTVRDSSGAVLPRVIVTVTNMGTNVSRMAITNETGDFVVPELIVGQYSVTAELAGFKKEVLAGLDLDVDQRLRVNVRMQVGSIAETVEVTAEATLIASDSATVGTVIDNRKVVDLPLNGRQFLQLNLLVPGAVPGTFGSQLSTQGGAISVNGMREAGNNFLLDGIDNNDLGINLLQGSHNPARWRKALEAAEHSIEESHAHHRIKYEALGLATRARARSKLDATPLAIEDASRPVALARSLGDPALLVDMLALHLALEGNVQLAAEARQTVDQVLSKLSDQHLRQRFLESESVSLVLKDSH